MSSRTRLALLALLVLPLPLPLGQAVPSASGPDEEGAWTLAFDVERPEAGSAAAILEVQREDADGILQATRDLGALSFPAGASRPEIAFLPAEGSGRYTVALVLDGTRVGEVAFDVLISGASQEISFDVPDAPTWLNLTSDDVNAAGKTKSPGEALLTRATIADDNGIGELDGVRWSAERAGVVLASGMLPIPAPANATSAPLELRFDRAPLPAGAYLLRLDALKAGAVVAGASRTFQIREVAPTFVAGAVANVTPDEDRVLETTVILADRNGPVGPGALDARAYRGSSRAEGAGVVATLGAPTQLADAEGAARWAYPLQVRVPARAAPGMLRVSLYANDTLLASLPFEVRALPLLRSVAVSTEAGQLRILPNASGDGIITARLVDASGAERAVTTRDLAAPIALAPPARGVTLRWIVELRARDDGPIVAERNGTWSAPFDGPALSLAPLHVRARLPAVWRVDAAGDITGASANVTFTRWDGAPAPQLRATLAHGRLRVDAPRDLEAGRYDARLLLTWPNGSASEARWSFEAGPWIELALGASVVEGAIARVPVENVGSLPVARLVAEAQPTARVTLRIGNATFAPREIAGRAVFSGFELAPGASGEIVVELPTGPRPAGRSSIALRVLAQLEAR